MSIADDLHTTAITAAANAITAQLDGSTVRADVLAEAAVEAARPYLVDTVRVTGALAARGAENLAGRGSRSSELWRHAEGDEHRYLDAMIEHGYLVLATLDRFDM
jgi:hypothetical protein